MLPPVADSPDTWEAAIERALDANTGTGRPDSLRALAKALAAIDGSPNEASWKTTLRRVRKNDAASEETARMLALGLGISRSDLPAAAERLTLQALERRLEEVAELVAVGFDELGLDVAGLRLAVDARSRRDLGNGR